MNWLPRFAVMDANTTDPFDDELPDYDGLCLVVSWLGWVVEIGVSRRAS